MVTSPFNAKSLLDVFACTSATVNFIYDEVICFLRVSDNNVILIQQKKMKFVGSKDLLHKTGCDKGAVYCRIHTKLWTSSGDKMHVMDWANFEWVPAYWESCVVHVVRNVVCGKVAVQDMEFTFYSKLCFLQPWIEISLHFVVLLSEIKSISSITKNWHQHWQCF